ncbi:MAG: hypothetical protein ABIJ47_11870 [Candidatus Bathyarchaeota archaeon]
MTLVNLMFQYHPERRAGEREELKRRLSSEEIAEAREMSRRDRVKEPGPGLDVLLVSQTLKGVSCPSYLLG